MDRIVSGQAAGELDLDPLEQYRQPAGAASAVAYLFNSNFGGPMSGQRGEPRLLSETGRRYKACRK
jgi:hypothetical protein